MTLTRLKLTSNTRFFKNFFFSVKDSRKMLIFTSIMQLLGYPLFAAVVVVMSASENSDTIEVSARAFILISVFCFIAAILCGIFIAISNFSYLYKKSQVDMVYSLPIKRRTKFLSDYLSGLSVYIIPYILALIIGNLIVMSGVICIPELKEAFTIKWQGSFAAFMMQGQFTVLLVMTMLYTLTVLVLCCCGSLFETIMNVFMINAVIPGMIMVFATMFFVKLYGVSVYETIIPILGYTSPIGAAIYGIRVLDDGLFYSSDSYCVDGAVFAKWAVLFLFFTAVYFALSMFLYVKRKAEDVSKPYVYKGLYYVLITVITMAISLIARFELSTLVPVIVFSLIVYMIFEVITNRGFKKIHISFIRYIATMAGILILNVAAIGTNGFGVQDRIYPPALIKSVEISYSGIDDFMSESDDDYFYNNCFLGENNYIEYKQKDIIKKAVDIQKQALETYHSGNYEVDIDGSIIGSNEMIDSYDYPACTVFFQFNLKTGGTVKRVYRLNVEQIKELFILDSTEQLAEYRANSLMESIKSKNYDTNKNKYYDEYNIYYSYMENFDYYKFIEISKEEAEKFVQLYKEDYLNTSIEQFMTTKTVCYINGSRPVRECFEKTIDFLKSHGVTDNLSEYFDNNDNIDGKLYQPKAYKSWDRDDITASFGYVRVLEGYSHSITNAQVKELMKYAYSRYMEEADCYVMKINGHYYVIPSQYSDIAERIYSESKTTSDKVTFEQMMTDMRRCDSPGDYQYKYLHDNYAFYEDITEIYYMKDLNEDEFREYGESEIETKYRLLKKFFGFYSAESYIEFMKTEKNTSLNEEEVSTEWEQFVEYFPEITNVDFAFYENLY